MPHRRRVAPANRDRGSVSIEMTMLVWPVAVIMAAFIAAAWLLAAARQDVYAAAASAARAATLQHSPSAATTAADNSAHTALANAGRVCADLLVTVDDTNFRHGGHVEVVVRCDIDLRGLTGLEIPGSVTFEGVSRAPIETFRELEGHP
jgi:Flp pilus assembly protein TadG